MNDQEFDTVRKRMFAVFPSLAEWGRWLDGAETLVDEKTKVTATVPHRTQKTVRNAIKQRWALALRSVGLQEALDALDALAAKPDDPWPYPGDKERAGAIVAEEARRKRPRESSPEARVVRTRGGDDFAAGTVFRKILRAIDADERHDDECRRHRSLLGRCRRGCPVPGLVAAELIAADTTTDDERNLPRYRCRWCEDRGVVTILQVSSIRAVAKTGSTAGLRTWAKRCTCSQRPDDWLEVLDESRDVPETLPRAELIVRCRAWVECDGVPRVAAFDRWNEGTAEGEL